jgi:hypothetical protein
MFCVILSQRALRLAAKLAATKEQFQFDVRSTKECEAAPNSPMPFTLTAVQT